MDLERIAMQRAEEQCAAFNFREDRDVSERRGIPMTSRTCSREGCSNPLAITNKSGVCYQCSDRSFRRRMAREAAKSSPNGGGR